MHLTPEILEANYRLLSLTLPFRRWTMPHPDVVEFRVLIVRDRHAHHRAYADGTGHEIAVSTGAVRTLDGLTQAMAHEMVHIRQDQLGMRDKHGAGFKRLAALVCRRHGFDIAKF